MSLGGVSMVPLIVSCLRRVRSVLAHAGAVLTIDPGRTYRPEAHYMRGPGPKWRAKHAQPEH
jgi:hypothetical protein